MTISDLIANLNTMIESDERLIDVLKHGPKSSSIVSVGLQHRVDAYKDVLGMCK